MTDIEQAGAQAGGVEAVVSAIMRCPSLDENGYICEKSAAIKAVRAALTTPAASPATERWPIVTDDEVEALARACDWDNRKYMTPADYAIWCERMRKFARLATPSPAPAAEPYGAVMDELDHAYRLEQETPEGGAVITSAELIRRCGGDPTAPFVVGPFPPEMRQMPDPVSPAMDYLSMRLKEARDQRPDWEKLWAEEAERAEAAQEEIETLKALICRIEPYVDAIVCYASTMGEHEPNRIAHEVRAVCYGPSQDELVGQQIAARMIAKIDAATTKPGVERAWLIELKGTTPSWAIVNPNDYDEHWTTDSTRALRFARKVDAEAYIAHIGWTEAFASEHVWDDGRRSSAPAPETWRGLDDARLKRAIDAFYDPCEGTTIDGIRNAILAWERG